MWKRAHSFNRGLLMGRRNEQEVLGRFNKTRAFQEAYRAAAERYKDQAKKPGWIPFDVARALVRDHYTERNGKPRDPTNPDKPFVRELRLAVAEELGIENWDRVRIYSAEQTPIDHFHGVDGWLEFDTDDKRTIMITLDATTMTGEDLAKDKEDAKADIIVSGLPDYDEEPDRFVERVESVYAAQVVNLIRRRQGGGRRERARR